MSWSRRFEEPIELPDGRKLKTLAEAMAWLAKEIPKSEHKMEKVQTAGHLVTRAAEHGGPVIFAQMGMHPAPCDICDFATVCSGPEGRRGYAFGNIFES